MLLSKRNLPHIARCVAVGMALLLFAQVLRAADAGEVIRLVAGVGFGGVLLSCLPQLGAIVLETLGWQLAFRAGQSRVRFAPLLRVRVASEALAQSLPVGVAFAESIKPLLLAKYCGLSVERSLAGMTARKVLVLVAQSAYVLALATLGFAGLEAVSRSVLGVPHLGWFAVASGAALGVAGGGMLLGLRQSAVARGTLGWLTRLPSQKLRAWLARRERAFAATDGAVSALFRSDFRTLLAPTLLFAGAWLLETVETWLILSVLGAHPSFIAVGSIEVIVSLVRSVVFVVPAGLGVQDLGYVACFSAFGVPEAASTGAAFALLKRGKELLWVAVGYALLGRELGALLGGPGPTTRPPLRLRPARA